MSKNFDLDALLAEALSEFEIQDKHASEKKFNDTSNLLNPTFDFKNVENFDHVDYNYESKESKIIPNINIENQLDDLLANLSKDLRTETKSFNPDHLDEDDQTILDEITSQIEENNTKNSTNETNDYKNILETMMSELMSKSMMYEPTQLICQKFPLWLELHR